VPWGILGDPSATKISENEFLNVMTLRIVIAALLSLNIWGGGGTILLGRLSARLRGPPTPLRGSRAHSTGNGDTGASILIGECRSVSPTCRRMKILAALGRSLVAEPFGGAGVAPQDRVGTSGGPTQVSGLASWVRGRVMGRAVFVPRYWKFRSQRWGRCPGGWNPWGYVVGRDGPPFG
jgi:hypothetical protein